MKLATREKPILFSGPLIPRLLDGTKTQTRRIANPQPPSDSVEVFYWSPEGGKPLDGWADPGLYYRTPRGLNFIKAPICVGDVLWVREGVWCYEHTGWTKSHQLRWPKFADDEAGRRWFDGACSYSADDPNPKDSPIGMLNKMFMPRWASRIDLEVTAVRSERLQDITEADAVAEGFRDRKAFLEYWEHLHKSIDLSQWVWVYTFKRIKP